MITRTAGPADMEQLVRIYNYEVLHGTATFDLNPKTIEERMEWFHAHNVNNHPLIVAELDGKAVGYASLSEYREKEAYAATVELSVYVDPDCRRRGIARRLMRSSAFSTAEQSGRWEKNSGSCWILSTIS